MLYCWDNKQGLNNKFLHFSCIFIPNTATVAIFQIQEVLQICHAVKNLSFGDLCARQI